MTAWSVIVPVKGGQGAKSRLPALVCGVPRARVAAALAGDTVAAIAEAASVRRVVVVSAARDTRMEWPVEVEVRLQSAEGLNGAIAEVARTLAGPVAVVLGDLPALRPGDVDDALALAGQANRAVVADAAGTGTTLLAARDGRLLPAFGAGSLMRHRALGYRVIEGTPRMRADVDTEQDLERARALGVGPLTAAALAETPLVSAG